MESHADISVQIDRYLNGQLNEAERSAFEARCQTDAAFAEAVRLHSQAEYLARSAGREQKRQELNQVFEAYRAETGASIHPLRRYALLAAAGIAFLLVLSLALGWWGNRAPDTLPELYTQYIEPYPFSPQRQGLATDSLWLRAAEAYTLGDYERSASLLTSLLADSSFTQQAKGWFYLGRSLLLQEPSQPAQARQAFAQVNAISSYYDNARWHIALAWLKVDNRVEAQAALAAIAQNDAHFRQAEASALLLKLAAGPKE